MQVIIYKNSQTAKVSSKFVPRHEAETILSYAYLQDKVLRLEQDNATKRIYSLAPQFNEQDIKPFSPQQSTMKTKLTIFALSYFAFIGSLVFAYIAQ